MVPHQKCGLFGSSSNAQGCIWEIFEIPWITTESSWYQITFLNWYFYRNCLAHAVILDRLRMEHKFRTVWSCIRNVATSDHFKDLRNLRNTFRYHGIFRILNHGPKFNECHHHCPWSPNGELSRVVKCTLSINDSIIHSKYFPVFYLL